MTPINWGNRAGAKQKYGPVADAFHIVPGGPRRSIEAHTIRMVYLAGAVVVVRYTEPRGERACSNPTGRIDLLQRPGYP